MAHRAAVDTRVIPPPPPIKRQHEKPVLLREAQPLSGGKSPQHSGPSVPIVLTEAPQAKGETPG